MSAFGGHRAGRDAEADAPNCADVARFAGRVPELAPKLRHVDVDYVVVAVPVGAPNCSEQLGPSENCSRARRQRVEYVELHARQFYPLVAPMDFAGSGVDSQVGDVARFRDFLRDLYIHRRKNLRQALAGSPRGRRDKGEVDAKLKDLGIDGSLRAEALDIPQHLRLCGAFG